MRSDAEVALPSPGASRPVFVLSTPGWLRTAMVAITITTVVFGVLGVRAAVERRDTSDTVALRSTPLLVDSQELYVALADADAAASTAFLRGGSEPTELRERYQSDIDRAGAELAALGSNPEASASNLESIAVIARQLPRYAGFVETARANNRLGHSVGAAYLREASELMQGTILPAATEIFTDAAIDLDAQQRSGTSRDAGTAVVASAVAVFAVLVATQIFVSRRTRRLLNVGLAISTLLVVGTAVVTRDALSRQEEWLSRARDEGSDQLIVLSEARILALRSLSDENLDLIERGSTSEHLDDFDVVTQSIGSTTDRTGLLGAAVDLADSEREERRIRAIGSLMDEYLTGHETVRVLVAARRYDDAVTAAVTQQAGAASALDAAIEAETDEAHADLERFAGSARDSVRWLAVAVLVLTVLAWASAVVGVRIRLKEYQ